MTPTRHESALKLTCVPGSHAEKATLAMKFGGKFEEDVPERDGKGSSLCYLTCRSLTGVSK